MSDSLTDFYNNLKSKLDNVDDTNSNSPVRLIDVGKGKNSVGANQWNQMANKERENLQNNCCKKILLNIYCNVIPLDPDYVDGNQGKMKSDLDAFLDKKGMSASKYLTACYEKTHAPLLGYLLHSSNIIGSNFMKEAKETLETAQENGEKLAPPESNVENQETQDQLVDVGKDPEYQTFIDRLKEKTINKIVTDVSKIISDKREEKEMTFNPTPAVDNTMGESVFVGGMDYLNKKMFDEHVNVDNHIQEEMIGLAIRESTLNIIDTVFTQPIFESKEILKNIFEGKGVVMNEAAVTYLKESAEVINNRFEPLYKEADGNKYDIANHEKISKDGTKTPMTDSEAKKYLDENGYKDYQNKK